MQIFSDYSLKKLNTFKVDVKAKKVVIIESVEDLFSDEVKDSFKKNFLVVGGASNILFTKDFDGTILLVRSQGIEVVDEDEKYTHVKVQAGESWDAFVQWSVKNNLMGLQNLAEIPGTVGATPVQNVGAYGVEVKDVLEYVEIYDIEKEQIAKISNKECNFAYRDSIFKHDLRNEVVITAVLFKLEKFTGKLPDRYFEYKGIEEKVKDKEKCTLQELYNIVKEIREEKLPSTMEYGSCGSTFKNSEITTAEYKEIKTKFPDLPSYPIPDSDLVKIPVAYILEQLGWKNKRKGDVGTWKYHPLIVTNYGNATADDVLAFIQDMQDDFKKNTGISLETEINII